MGYKDQVQTRRGKSSVWFGFFRGMLFFSVVFFGLAMWAVGGTGQGRAVEIYGTKDRIFFYTTLQKLGISVHTIENCISSSQLNTLML